MAAMVGVGDDLAAPARDLLGQPLRGDQHGQRDDERHDPPVGDQQPVHQPAARADGQRAEHHHHGPVRLGGHASCPDRGQRHDLAHRQVDAAADDHDRDPDRDHADHRGRGQDREQVGAGEERVGGGHAHDAQQHQHARPGRGCAPARSPAACSAGWPTARPRARPAPPGSARRRRARPSRRRRCVGMASGLVLSHARFPPSPGRAPGSRRGRRRARSRTTRPSRTTSTRSARPSTSGTSLDTSTTATPESASLRISA